MEDIWTCRGRDDYEHMSIKSFYEDSVSLSCVGEHRDKITNLLTGEVTYAEGFNIFVFDVLKIITSLMKNQAGYGGILFWAVGSGQSSWDTTPPAADPTRTRLVNEIYRKAPDSIKWINEDNTDSASPTNRLEVVTTFTDTQGNGTWRELGLFGGNATSTINTGIMINHRLHGVLQKTNEISVERRLRLSFRGQ